MRFTYKPKGRARTSDYQRLDSQFLKTTAHLPVGSSHTMLIETPHGRRPMIGRREKENIFIHFGKNVWRVFLRPYKLTYGVRYWFGCPHCGRRCSFFYLIKHEFPLACRECVRPAYTCQNSSQFRYLQETALSLRKSLWGDREFIQNIELDDLRFLQFLKPKGRWWKTFERDFEKLVAIEKKKQAHQINSLW